MVEEQKKEFRAPIGLDTILSFLKGVNWNIKNVHIRYEDSFNKKPLSFGFRIEEIDFSSATSHWNFFKPNECAFKRQQNKFINKELSIVNFAVYVEEGIMIPIDVFKSSQDHESVFSSLDPEQVRNFMNRAMDQPYEFIEQTPGPGKSTAVQMQYLVEPMFVNIALNFNTCYVPDYKEQPFRYNICTMVSDVKINLNPEVLRQVVASSSCAFMRGYQEQLKKFRPRIRIQALLSKCRGGKRSTEM